ncbi:MAG: PilN domain-containing protein [Planctomycetes bacterium]|nr:PilN domain-containing protein [Planctomycetota bacterium]
MAKPNSTNCLVGFELAGDRIRIAAIQGPNPRAQPRDVRFEEIIIPQGAASPGQNLPPVSVLVPLLKTALGRMGLNGGSAVVALQGSRLVLRNFVGPDKQVRAELRQTLERSVDYVQFGMGDRAVGEHLRSLEDGRVHGLLGVSASTTIDPLAKTFEQVGLGVQSIEPALVAATRIAAIAGQINDEATLLVLMEEDGMDIGVASGGHLLFGCRPRSLAGAEAGDSSRVSSLPRELQRVARHCQRIFGMSQEVRRVVLFGSDDLVQPHAKVIEHSGEFHVERSNVAQAARSILPIPLEDLVESNAHATALGAAASLVRGSHGVVGPNLISKPETQHPPRLETAIRCALWPTLAAILIWGGVQLFQGRLETAEARLRIEVEASSPNEIRCRELQIQLTEAEQRAQRLNELVAKFGDRHWTLPLEAIHKCVPDRLWCNSVRQTATGHLTISGAAQDEEVVYEFRKRLEDTPWLDSVSISSTSRSQLGSMLITDFALECVVVSDASPSAVSNP